LTRHGIKGHHLVPFYAIVKSELDLLCVVFFNTMCIQENGVHRDSTSNAFRILKTARGVMPSKKCRSQACKIKQAPDL